MKGLAALVLLAGVAVSAQSETNRPSLPVYGEADCIRIALERSSEARLARLEKETADAYSDQAWSELFPHFSARAGYTRLDSVDSFSFGGTEMDIGTPDAWEIGAGVDQLVYSGGRVKAGLRAAGKYEQYSSLLEAERRNRLVRDVRSAFYDLLLARESVVVRDAAVRQLEDVLADSERRREHGAASEFDVLQAGVKLGNERPEAIRARNAQELAKLELARRMGLDRSDGFEVSGGLSELGGGRDSESLLKDALERRPMIRAQDVLTALRAEEVRVARSGVLPELRGFFDWRHSNSSMPSFGDKWESRWTAGLALDWKLWDGGMTSGKIREKKIALERAETEREEMRRSVVMELRAAVLDYDRSLLVVNAARGNVELAARAVDIARERFRNGMTTFLNFSEASVGYRVARLQYLSAVCDLAKASAAIEYACGSGSADYAGKEIQ